MKNFLYFNRVAIRFGQKSLCELVKICKQYGTKGLLVTTKDLDRLGFVNKIERIIGKQINLKIITDIKSEPSSSDVDKFLNIVGNDDIDFVIGLGGGSAIDVAKSLAVVIPEKNDIWNYVKKNDQSLLDPTERTLSIIAIPTTSGTGSEVTPYAVLKNPDTGEKATIKSPHIFPRVAIIDPQLTTTLPKKITAVTGIDALSQSIESFLNLQNRTPFSKMFALESISKVAKYLPKVYEDGLNVDDRGKMAFASMLSGLAISQVGTSAIHAMGEALSGYVKISHGESVALFVSSVLKRTWNVCKEDFAKIAEAMNPSLTDFPVCEKAKLCIYEVDKLLSLLDLNIKISHFNPPEDIINKLLKDTTAGGYKSRAMTFNPKVFSKEELGEIYAECF